jgi:hypothetical protein
MEETLGLLTGAGISSGPPANLPLGDEFDRYLLAFCHQAASNVPHLSVDEGTQKAIRDCHRNVLGCVQGCLDEGSLAAFLGCFRVTVPTEAHLLAAAHTARGTLHVTLNFDDGVERAYALLAGEIQLPGTVPAAHHRTLRAWRARIHPTAPLSVISLPCQVPDAVYRQRPLLVKLRGSVDASIDSAVLPTQPVLEDLEANYFENSQLVALREVTKARHLFIAGHSGADLDCRESLLPLLRPGHFSWAAAALPTDLAGRVRLIDPSQPIVKNATQALRSSLPDLADLPEWPRQAVNHQRFAQLFTTWCASIPPRAAAEAYAWLLSEAGEYDQAVQTLEAILALRDHPRTRLRLADVLWARNGRVDRERAVRLFQSASLARRTPVPLRAYGLIRWAECHCSVLGGPVSVLRLSKSIMGVSAALLLDALSSARRDLRIRGRGFGGLGSIGRYVVEAGLPSAMESSSTRTRMRMAAHLARVSLRRALRYSAQAGTAHRQTTLHQQLAEIDTLVAILAGGQPPADVHSRLRQIQRAHQHRSNRSGLVTTLVARSLAQMATGELSEGLALLDEAEQINSSWVTRVDQDCARLIERRRAIAQYLQG